MQKCKAQTQNGGYTARWLGGKVASWVARWPGGRLAGWPGGWLGGQSPPPPPPRSDPWGGTFRLLQCNLQRIADRHWSQQQPIGFLHHDVGYPMGLNDVRAVSGGAIP